MEQKNEIQIWYELFINIIPDRNLLSELLKIGNKEKIIPLVYNVNKNTFSLCKNENTWNRVIDENYVIPLSVVRSVTKDFITRVNKKKPHHTFIVYKSGAVTQSAPCGDKNKINEAFNIFSDIFTNFEDEIRYKYVEINPKYKKITPSS